MRVSVLGATGLLGTRVVRGLHEAGIATISASRSASGPDSVRFDLATGDGLDAAIEECDAVILLSSNPRKAREVDVEGTRRLLPRIGQRHLIFMSIVGVDRHPLAFYRAKHEIEGMIASTVPHFSILRATQFHDLVGYVLERLSRFPICLVPRSFVFQPIDTDEVAQHLVDIARSGPGGLMPDLAGPEVLRSEYLGHTYMEAIGRERPLLAVPIPGKVSRAFRLGLNTNPDRAIGKRSWEQYLGSLS